MSGKGGWKRFILAVFCRYYEKRENRAWYTSISVVIVAYKVCRGTFADPQYLPPPVAGWSNDPTLTKNFLFFSTKNEVVESIEKN